jgi:hypothetical protein
MSPTPTRFLKRALADFFNCRGCQARNVAACQEAA